MLCLLCHTKKKRCFINQIIYVTYYFFLKLNLEPEFNCRCAGGKIFCHTDKPHQQPLLCILLVWYLLTKTLFHQTEAPAQHCLPAPTCWLWAFTLGTDLWAFHSLYKPRLLAPGHLAQGNTTGSLTRLVPLLPSHPRWADSWLWHHWPFWINFPNLGSEVCRDRWHHLSHPGCPAYNYPSFLWRHHFLNRSTKTKRTDFMSDISFCCWAFLFA